MNRKVKLGLLGFAATIMLVAGCTYVSSSNPDGGLRPGGKAPDFSYTLNGQSGLLSDLRGEPVLVNFWATWCGPCRSEMPLMQGIYKDYSSQGLVMLMVNLGESPNTVSSFLQASKLDLPVVPDTTSSINRAYRVNAIPATYFVDKSGMIRGVKIGAFSSKGEIESYLKTIMQ